MRNREPRARSVFGAPIFVEHRRIFAAAILRSDSRLSRRAAVCGAVVLLACLPPASAGFVRFYFTSSADPAGLSDPSLAFKNTSGNGTDGTDYALNGELPSVSAPTIDAHKGEFLYLWVAFEDEPNNRKIQGINITIDGDGWETTRGLYLGDDENGSGGSIRWNLGSQTTDPIVLVAIEEPGIVNVKDDGWLYHGGDTRTALLGAIAFDGKFNGEIRLGLERQGVSYERRPAPHVKFGDNEEYREGHVGEPPTWWSTDPDAYVIPEPATLMSLILSAAAIRHGRRQRCV